MLSAEKIQKLKEYFAKQENVVLAFLFGSQAKERAIPDSDWDIAVYFKPEVEPLEWEEHGREYPEENRIWDDCADILKTDKVDMVVLNRAPSSIADTALRGIPLAIKDYRLLLRFMLIISREAEDFRGFVNDYYQISQRSLSLTPTDREDLQRTINFVEEQMQLYAYFAKFSGAEYEKEILKRNEVERWVENIINASIDIAKILLSSQKKLIPESYRATMQQAVWRMSLPENFIEKFEIWVKLRNVLAHEYLDIKWKKIENFIHESESYFQRFLSAAKKFLEEN